MRIERQWHADWRNLWKDALDRANPGVICCELRESLLIEALYPLSSAATHPGELLKRIPTIGAIALALADVLPDLLGLSVSTFWAAGFGCRRHKSLRHALESIAMIFDFKSWPWSQELPMVLCGLSARPILLCTSLEHGRICPELV